MKSKRLLLIFILVVPMLVIAEPVALTSQQTQPCNTQQAKGTLREPTELEECHCEQSSVTEKPTYRVGNNLFGSKASAQPKDLYDKLEIPEIPDANDLKSPEVTGLKQQLLSERESRRQAAEKIWREFQDYPYLPIFEGKKRAASLRNAYNRYQELLNNSSWSLLPKFDWRERGLDVGPVMQQGECGSCWAFAAMSVYQSSWNLEQLRMGHEFFDTFIPEYSYNRIPSVQQLLNCVSKDKGSCGGGWHGTAFAFMVNFHVPHIPDRLVWNRGDKVRIEEYTGRKSPCTDLLRNSKVKRGGQSNVPLDGPDSRPKLTPGSDKTQTSFDRALAWGYVNEQKPRDMPSVEQLKAALIEHGPLAITILGDNCFFVYRGGVFNGHNSGDTNHAIVLIGWDDSKSAWLIKNSWGTKWGENGFGWVEYGSNNVGLYAAWIQPSPSIRQ
jgi:C1A family cysteine protease